FFLGCDRNENNDIFLFLLPHSSPNSLQNQLFLDPLFFFFFFFCSFKFNLTHLLPAHTRFTPSPSPFFIQRLSETLKKRIAR
ncbi:hypothetical protein K457DRAFT_28835, partial [Linnemannia elongata AG-77]